MSAAGLHVVRQESAAAWTEIVSRPPAASLRGYVRRYTGYREESAAPMRRREVPSGDVHLILSFGPRIRVLDLAGPATVPDASSGIAATSFVARISDTWTLTEYTGAQYGLQVSLTPVGASMLLGVPMGSLPAEPVDLEELLGGRADGLVERLTRTAGWAARFELLDGLLRQWLADARSPSPAAAWAWRRLVQTDGRVTIGALVDELGCSHQYLVSAFRAHVGVTPKTMGRILRCQRAIRLLGHDHDRRIADVALACGYYDQAHLNRDFRQLTGLTPSQWPAGSLLGAPELPAL